MFSTNYKKSQYVLPSSEETKHLPFNNFARRRRSLQLLAQASIQLKQRNGLPADVVDKTSGKSIMSLLYNSVNMISPILPLDEDATLNPFFSSRKEELEDEAATIAQSQYLENLRIESREKLQRSEMKLAAIESRIQTEKKQQRHLYDVFADYNGGSITADRGKTYIVFL